jgi:ATP-dependent DNA helicase RecG
VAHRDYAAHGRGVEVWLFDDRLEVTSPGGLLPDVSLEDLLEMKRVHISRSPRLVRTLVDLGFMRDQGEGIARMFWEMQSKLLPPPEVEEGASMDRVTLRNTMTISKTDRAFIESLGTHELAPIEFKALLEAHQRGRIDNARLRAITGLDTLRSSKLPGALRDRDLLDQHAAGSASYYTVHSAADASATLLENQSQDLDAQSQDLDAQSQDLVQSQAHALDAAHAVPAALEAEIQALGKRPGERKLRRLIERLCQTAPRDTVTLANILHRNPEALARHLRAMLKTGRLRFRFPENRNHPAQAYVATQPRLLDEKED